MCDLEQGISEEAFCLQPLLQSSHNSSRNQILDSDDTIPELADETSTVDGCEVDNTSITESEFKLLDAVKCNDVKEVERLLESETNPNAICPRTGRSASHIAARQNESDSLRLLLKFGANKTLKDRQGCTPLHVATLTGNNEQMALLLDSQTGDVHKVSDETIALVNEPVAQRTALNKEVDLYEISPGWTALHIASSNLHYECTAMLLSNRADPTKPDTEGFTSLDVAGSRTNNLKHFAEVIRLLSQAIKDSGKHNVTKIKGFNGANTPLHTAVAVEDMDIIKELLNYNAPTTCLNAHGLTPLHICVNMKLEQPLQILMNHGINEIDSPETNIDVVDKEGRTVLRAAVDAQWLPGVRIALLAGADVTLKAKDGETPIHTAAAIGNSDILNEIIYLAKQNDFIEYENEKGETPLFKAVSKGHYDCYKSILEKVDFDSIKKTFRDNVNIIHVAAEGGNSKILKELLKVDDTNDMINALTDDIREGFAPIHFAIWNNNLACFKLLLSHKNIDLCIWTTFFPHNFETPIQLAIAKNRIIIVQYLLHSDKKTVNFRNGMGWSPLHTASYYGNREIIQLLLREGADLSENTHNLSDMHDPAKVLRWPRGNNADPRITAIDMIMRNIQKPTEFMEEIFDSCIVYKFDPNMNYQNYEIYVDYKILAPNECGHEQMKVIQALLKTGNKYGQKRLLVHPLVETFFYFKWKSMFPFIFLQSCLFSIYLIILTFYIITMLRCKDLSEPIITCSYDKLWVYFITMYTSIGIILLQEILYIMMNVRLIKYILQWETWFKFGAIGLSMTLMPTVSLSEWQKHVATAALLLSWIEMMFLQSWFREWGNYVQMFGKIARKIVKILITFSFLVIGFTLTFMIQFRSLKTFDNFWTAFVKTLVMMTSEFDYGSLIDADSSKDSASSLVIMRLIFVIFLIVMAIIFMNFMVGVAVSDINEVQMAGVLNNLSKQMTVLGNIDVTILKKRLPKIVYNILRSTLFYNYINLKYAINHNYNKFLPPHFKEYLLSRVLTQKTEVVETEEKRFERQIDEMYHRMSERDKLMQEIQKQLLQMNDSKNLLNRLERKTRKIDQMSLEIKNLKKVLCKAVQKCKCQKCM